MAPCSKKEWIHKNNYDVSKNIDLDIGNFIIKTELGNTKTIH